MAKKKSHRRKGYSFNDLIGAGIVLVVAGVMFGIGAYINTQIQSVAGWGTTTTAYLAVSNATAALATLSSWLQIIAVVLAASIVIGILVRSFMGRGQEGGI